MGHGSDADLVMYMCCVYVLCTAVCVQQVVHSYCNTSGLATRRVLTSSVSVTTPVRVPPLSRNCSCKEGFVKVCLFISYFSM